MKVKTTDIERTASGFDRLPCDGRHATAFHFYMYYTKREIVASWRDAHRAMIPCNECGVPVVWYIHEEELGMCVDCSNAYFNHEGEQ